MWWQWPDWEKHIDWMALNGINLPLAFNGQEEIWRRVWTKLGLGEKDLDEHTGPAQQTWAGHSLVLFRAARICSLARQSARSAAQG